MNLRFLETFVWVARLGSFRATASKLHVTQAAVSGRMAALENDLQTQLFVRQGRQMGLSAAGKILLQHAEGLLKAEQALRHELSAPLELRGRIRVGVMETIVYTWFGDFLSQLQKHHPHIELEITVESSRRLHALLKSGLIDIALQTHPVIDKSIRNAPLGRYEMQWMVADHAATKAPISLEQVLQSWTLVTFPRYSQPHVQLLELLENYGLSDEPMRIHFASSIEAALQLLRTGRCIGAMPVTLLCDNKKPLVVVPQLPKLEAMHLVASWRPEPVYATISTIINLSLKAMEDYAHTYPQVVTASEGLPFAG